MFGLTDEDIEVIRGVLGRYGDVSEAIVFGSRAMGSHKPGSDVDIALKGSGGSNTALDVSTELNQETNLPFFFDIIDFHSIDNNDLIQHINRVGLPIYLKLGEHKKDAK